MADNKENNIENLTPMMKQYYEIKNEYSSYILFYRLGDFYEMFDDDAVNISKELELTLTARNGTPMCGVPYHSSEIYIKRLIEKGFRVAICEQVSDPSEGKGLVDREVVRLVTAGTVIESSMLDENKNNFICCMFVENEVCSMVFADISTGEIHLYEKSGKKLQSDVINELTRYMPVEILFNNGFLDLKQVHAYIKDKMIYCIAQLIDDDSFLIKDMSVVLNQFDTDVLNELNFAGFTKVNNVLCAIFKYFLNAHKAAVKRFVKLNIHTNEEFLYIGQNTRRNLELTETMRNKERRGSLIWVLDKTSTSMGKRRLKTFIEQPLINPAEILRRLDAVEVLCNNSTVMYDLSDILKKVYDLERLMSRIVYNTASPKDVYALGITANSIPEIKQVLSSISSPLLDSINNNISSLEEVASLIDNAIVAETPANTREGGFICDGFNEELDNLRKITGSGKEILLDIENEERIKTGIKNLKVSYNRVFGYFIEVSKSNISQVPNTYVRKQTLSNCERYITAQLKDIESQILSSNDRIKELENKIFEEIKTFISSKLEIIQTTAEAISYLDVLISFGITSVSNGYVKPEIAMNGIIDIKDGRHPVIEQILENGLFVPNDTYLDLKDNRLIILTGPNMAGKSTYMRQIALITLMAQMGCFIPAKYGRIGIVDKIFTRVGASDDLTSGQSTFMVEMNEVAEILQNATSNSLVILDEIGRGTSTFDGISIAKAVAEHISSNKGIGCKTLFATHYHELISLEMEQNGIKNFSVAVNKNKDGIKFLHKIVSGGVDDSYGIEVAKLAGLPNKIITRAKEVLHDMEVNSKQKLDLIISESKSSEIQFDFAHLNEQNALNRIKNLDENITPEQAKEMLLELKLIL